MISSRQRNRNMFLKIKRADIIKKLPGMHIQYNPINMQLEKALFCLGSVLFCLGSAWPHFAYGSALVPLGHISIQMGYDIYGSISELYHKEILLSVKYLQKYIWFNGLLLAKQNPNRAEQSRILTERVAYLLGLTVYHWTLWTTCLRFHLSLSVNYTCPATDILDHKPSSSDLIVAPQSFVSLITGN